MLHTSFTGLSYRTKLGSQLFYREKSIVFQKLLHVLIQCAYMYQMAVSNSIS